MTRSQIAFALLAALTATALFLRYLLVAPFWSPDGGPLTVLDHNRKSESSWWTRAKAIRCHGGLSGRGVDACLH